MRKNKKGFTLVELVIVIAVIAILAGVMIAVFANVVNDAKESAKEQEAKQAELQQKMEDIAKKLENPEWLSWEDFEKELAEKLSEQNTVTAETITSVVEQYLKESGMENTGITEEQMIDILDRALSGQLTKEQVEAIVAKYQNESGLTSAEVRRIITAALANQLTASQVKELLLEQSNTWETKLQEIIDENEATQKELNEKIDSLSELLNKYLGSGEEVVTVKTPEDLQNAITAAENGKAFTIKLTEDMVVVAESGTGLTIDENKIITLDISGVTLDLNTVKHGIYNKGVLSIVGDGNSVLDVSGIGSVSGTSVNMGIANFGTLEIRDIKIVAPDVANFGVNRFALYSHTNANLIAKNIEITGPNGVNNFCANSTLRNCKINVEGTAISNSGGYITVNGGELSRSSTATAAYVVNNFYDATSKFPAYSVYNDVSIKGQYGAIFGQYGNMVLNDCTVETNKSINGNRAIYCAGHYAPTFVTVNGGTVSGTTAMVVGNAIDGGKKYTGTLKFTNGTVDGKISVDCRTSTNAPEGCGKFINKSGQDISDKIVYVN